ncbi:hypothetical protein BDQ12DRAFT_668354 [Crucibulum laeve]|uniref:Uncharacterized protein n=1 Tax=Crucibulum laeve TaxID=68775 RepID=A0A5C3LUU3_9AGAR|nr:hypothetical protein BDQ12DRAFT_668354 [Crucibulum laeve]
MYFYVSAWQSIIHSEPDERLVLEDESLAMIRTQALTILQPWVHTSPVPVNTVAPKSRGFEHQSWSLEYMGGMCHCHSSGSEGLTVNRRWGAQPFEEDGQYSLDSPLTVSDHTPHAIEELSYTSATACKFLVVLRGTGSVGDGEWRQLHRMETG